MTALSAAGFGATGRRSESALRHVDVVMVAVTAALAGLGLLMISSATYRRQLNAGFDPHTYLKKQVLYMVIGVTLMTVIALIDYGEYIDRAPLLYGMSFCSLVGVLVLGTVHKGARNWFDFGPFQLQPSEFAKIVVVVALAAYGSAQRSILDGKRFVMMLLVAGVPVGLIFLEPDLGTALVFLAIIVALLWVAGARRFDRTRGAGARLDY